MAGFQCREAVKVRLKASFNQLIVSKCIAVGVEPFEIDFEDGSTSFAEGALGAMRDTNDEYTYPGMELYVTSAVHTGRPKFRPFAGTVGLAVDVHITADSLGLLKLERLADIVEETMFEVINPATSWPAAAQYNGDLAVQRFPLRAGGAGVLQTLRATCSFLALSL